MTPLTPAGWVLFGGPLAVTTALLMLIDGL